MSGNKNLLILIFTIPLLIFVGILFFNNNKTSVTYLNALHQGQNQAQNQGQGQANSSSNYNFTANEVPAFNFPSVAYASDLQKDVSIYNSAGEKMNADVTVSANKNGSSVQLNKTQQFLPGKYSLVLNRDGKKIEQDFTWGVLAINPNKSIYTPGEIAKLALAVLDEKGNMVCDAKVTLDIKGPLGQTTTLSAQNGTIIVNPECMQKKMTFKPDYEADYKVGLAGNYQMSLTAVTKNGTYNIVDFFTVEENADFDVERITATRIFPYSIYPVSIKIIAKKDFAGQIREVTPASLAITPLENTVSYKSIEKNTEIQYILWDVSLKKGESLNIGYNFKAPLISPQFYLLGPLSLVSGNASVFEEKRVWQLAIDSIEYSQTILNTSGLIAYWRLGEASGTVASDEMGNLDLDYINTPTLGAAGLVAGDSNTAVTFSRASTEYAKSTATGMPAGSASGVTLEAWANFTTLVAGEYQTLVSWGYVSNTVNYAFLRFLNYSAGYPNDIEYGWSDGTAYQSVYYAPSGGFGIATGQTHHFVVVHNYTAETVTFYLDGALLNTADVSAYATPVAIPANQPVGLAMYTGNEEYGLNGKLDESAIYNVPLSAETVLGHYNTGVALNANLSCDYPDTVLADTPVAYWRLGESVEFADAFTRSVSDGWGSADTGGAYTLTGTAADFDVNGTKGTIALGATGYVNKSAILGSVSVLEADVKVSVSLDKRPSGAGSPGVYAGPVVRAVDGNNLYFAEFIVEANGTARIQIKKRVTGTDTVIGTLYTSGTYTAGETWWVRLKVTGASPTVLTAKYWKDGDAEPGWLDTASDSTAALQVAESVGVRVWADDLTNNPLVVSWDNLTGVGADNAEGTAALDGTYVNTPTLGVAGALTGDSDTSATFVRPSSQYIRVPDNASLDLGNGPLSYELWFKKTTGADASDSFLIEKGVQSPAMAIDGGTGLLSFFSYNWSSAVTGGSHVILDTNWHHFVGTVSSGGTWLLYLDGVDVTTFIANPGTQVSTATDLFIGSTDTPSGFANGTIDEVATYNVVLTPAQILNHYNTGTTPSCGSGNFRFDGLKMEGIKIN